MPASPWMERVIKVSDWFDNILILLALEDEPSGGFRDEEYDEDLEAGGDSNPLLKLPPNHQLLHHIGGSKLAQTVGDEEGDGDEAVVADPGEPLETPLEPNRLHQVNLEVCLEAKSLDWMLPG